MRSFGGMTLDGATGAWETIIRDVTALDSEGRIAIFGNLSKDFSSKAESMGQLRVLFGLSCQIQV